MACRPALPRSSQPCHSCIYSCSPYPSAGGTGWPSKMTTLRAPFLPSDKCLPKPHCLVSFFVRDNNGCFISQTQKMGRCQNDQEGRPNLSCVPESAQRWAWCQRHRHSREKLLLSLPSCLQTQSRPTFPSVC